MNETTLRCALRSASRAPSIHNSQPWAWVLRDGSVELHLDRTRLLGAADPDGREALLSVGVALDHLRATLAALGWHAAITTFPNPNDLDHVATLDPLSVPEITQAQHDRVTAMLMRRTDRLPMGAPPNWPEFEAVVRPLVDSDAVVMHVLPESDRVELAAISRLASADRRYDTAYHAELDWWTHTGALVDSGIPASQRISGSEERRVDLGREFPLVTGQSRRAQYAHDESVVVVLSTRDDSLGDVLRCGAALSVVLLEATMAGLRTCTVTHVTEDPVCRARLGHLIGGDRLPQLLVRIGSAPTESVPTATQRRSVDDLLTLR